MATAQLNVRINQDTKNAGDAVLQREGISAARAISRLWQHMAAAQSVPDFITQGKMGDEDEVVRMKLDSIRNGAGMALRLAQEYGLATQAFTVDEADYKTLRDEMYDDILNEYLERCHTVEGERS